MYKSEILHGKIYIGGYSQHLEIPGVEISNQSNNFVIEAAPNLIKYQTRVLFTCVYNKLLFLVPIITSAEVFDRISKLKIKKLTEALRR